MRYLICKNDVTENELYARMKYIYDVFHVYTSLDCNCSNENIVQLVSIPTDALDLIVLIGHDSMVKSYLLKNILKMPEKNIVVSACNTNELYCLGSIKNKNIYLPRNKGIIRCYDGGKVGFDFDITDEENMLYRYKDMTFNEMFENVLERIWKWIKYLKN